jgi:hypothetical protein
VVVQLLEGLSPDANIPGTDAPIAVASTNGDHRMQVKITEKVRFWRDVGKLPERGMQ